MRRMPALEAAQTVPSVATIRSETFESVAAARGVTFAPIAADTGPGFRRDRSLFADDRFHPNARGYATWLPTLDRTLEKALAHH